MAELKKCAYTHCGKEFEPKRKNQKYCCPMHRKFAKMKDDPIFGGGIKVKGNSVEVKGALNVALFMTKSLFTTK